MFFVLSISAIVAIALIIAKLVPEEQSFLLLEAAFAKRLSKGKISFEAIRLVRQRPQGTGQRQDTANGNTLLNNVQLSNLAQVASENAKPYDARNFADLASRLLVDCVAVDEKGNIVAALVAKANRAAFVLEVLRSANIHAARDRAVFDAQLERIDDARTAERPSNSKETP